LGALLYRLLYGSASPVADLIDAPVMYWLSPVSPWAGAAPNRVPQGMSTARNAARNRF